ncbi:PREDICTED: ankyrin repeat domain-containing protein 54-like [Priapulus caudatus]|uniref:Ankyrin repeat domain-containing protein 54-like n=1 Tax=Priapulus caudatus TaxID=37621 RepID=A0ABM1F0S1_PRICU|nr:PREDICTED: ankyrin repeat domain-containing protein 54-like [Priapulus caudatus]
MREEKMDIVRQLLEARADPNVADPKSGEKLLIKEVILGEEAMEGEEAMVQMLLSHGADANAAVNSYGDTSLHIAAYSGRMDIMRLLLKARANPNVANTESGETLLMKAVKEGEEAMVRMLLSMS